MYGGVVTHGINPRELLGEVHHEGNGQLLSVRGGADLGGDNAKDNPQTSAHRFGHTFLFKMAVKEALCKGGYILRGSRFYQREDGDPGLPVRFILLSLHLFQISSWVVSPL